MNKTKSILNHKAKDIDFDAFMELNPIAQTMYVGSQIEKWKFVGYPDILDCLDQCIKNNHSKDFLLFLFMLDFNHACQIFEEEKGICAFKESILKDPASDIMIKYVQDVIKIGIEHIDEDDIQNFTENAVFMLSVLSSNQLRRKAIPLFQNFFQDSFIKKCDITEFADYVDELCVDAVELETNGDLIFTAFLFWLCKRYDYAMTLMQFAELRNEKLLGTTEEDAIFKECRKLLDSVKVNKNPYVSYLMGVLYQASDFDFPANVMNRKELAAEALAVTKMNLDKPVSLAKDALAMYLYALDLVENLNDSIHKQNEELKTLHQREIPKEAPKISALKKEISQLKNEKNEEADKKTALEKKLQSTASDLKKANEFIKVNEKKHIEEIRKYKQEIREMEKQLQEAHKQKSELSRLRHYVYHLSFDENTAINEEENSRTFQQLVKEKKILLFGGHTKMLEKMKKKYPQIDTLDVRDINTFNDAIVPRYDCICINTRFLNHSCYYRLMSLCDKYQVDTMYLGNENLERITSDIIQHFEELNENS